MTGWSCTGGSSTTASICNTICGDSILVGPEICDDGGVGCLFDCSGSKATYNCAGNPTICTPKCGDGV